MKLHGRNTQGGSVSRMMSPLGAGTGSNDRPALRPPSHWSGIGTWLRQWLLSLPHPADIDLQPRRPHAPDSFSRAIECLHRGEWQAAFDAMAQAADRGDRRAARIALLMLERGPRLFSQRFCASPTQRARWAEDPACRPHDPIHGTHPTE
jgi:hypothetical protein